MTRLSKNSGMSVAIVGNCQVRPLAEILSHHDAVNDKIDQIIVHLSQPESAEQDYQMLQAADLILCQLVADNYPIEHVRTDRIKSTFADKVVVWPNVFFHGQNPDLIYATGAGNKRIVGPIDVYHSRSLIELWQQSVDPIEINANNYISSVYSHSMINDQVNQSFRDLKQRELKTDIKMSPFIREHWQSEKLFHTFNHPSAITMKALAMQIIQHIGINAESLSNGPEFNDWLGIIKPPFEQSIANMLGITYDIGGTIAGVALRDNQAVVVPGQYQNYSFSEFVQTSFECYNAQKESMAALRHTPAMAA